MLTACSAAIRTLSGCHGLASKRHRAEVFGVIETALRAHFAREIEA
jgi:hypothetical protein